MNNHNLRVLSIVCCKVNNYKRITTSDSIRLVGLLALLLFAIGCTPSQNKNATLDELKNLDGVNRIEIFHRKDFKSVDYHVKTLDNPEDVNLAIQSFGSYANNWQSFHPYAPPGPLYVEFYSKNERKLGIMIGYTHNSSSGNTIFHLSQPYGLGKLLAQGEFEELMSTLKIDNNLAYYDTRTSDKINP